MSSGSTTLPPSALANAQAQARIDQIAVRILNLPDGLQNNPTPVKVSGTVAGQNQDGSVNIKTDQGEIRILLRDRGSLPQGSKIDIEIPAGRNPQQANIRQSAPEVNTEPPSLARSIASQNQSPSAPNPLTQNIKLNTETLSTVITSSQIPVAEDAVIPIAGGTLQVGQTTRLIPVPPGSFTQQILDTLAKPLPLPALVTGLVNLIENLSQTQTSIRAPLIQILNNLDLSSLTRPPAPASQVSGPPQLSPHTQLLGKIDGLLQSIGLPAKFNIETQAPLPAAPPPPSPSTFAVFNPSKPVDGQILAFQPAMHGNIKPDILVNSQPVNTTNLSNTPIAAAQVLGFTPDTKLPVLSIPLPHTGMTQVYTMQFRADNLTAGSPVFIGLDPLSIKPAHTLFIQTAIDESLHIDARHMRSSGLGDWINAGNWDTLDTLLKTMMHIAPQQAQSMMQMIPSPAQPQHMGALSLFFLSMVRAGDMDGWIGSETASLLRQFGKIDFLRAAGTDLNLTSRLDGLSLPQDWRMTMIPLLWDQQVYKAPLYYKHFRDDTEKEGDQDKKRRKLRFLFDLNLSRMGEVQVDGFMQSERLDLILRTKSPLSPPMQSQMKRIYAGAMDKSRLTGDLSFQFKPEQWVDFTQNFEKTGVNA